MDRQSNLISAFDIIGPIMVGPSSSHTAGALRIAALARSLLKKRLAEVDFCLYGSFARTYAGHGTDRALLGGALGLKADDLRIRDAFDLAEKEGLRYRFTADTKTQLPHPNTVDISMKDEAGDVLFVRGVSIGGGLAVLTMVNDIELEFSGAYHTLLISHEDAFGVLSSIVDRLSMRQINIANLKCSRKKNHMAITVIEIDDEISIRDRELLAELPHIHHCLYIRKVEV